VSILASDLDAKRLEVLHDCVPLARRIAVLADPTTVSTRAQVNAAGPELVVEVIWFEARNADEIDRALDGIVAAKVEAVPKPGPHCGGFGGLWIGRLAAARFTQVNAATTSLSNYLSRSFPAAIGLMRGRSSAPRIIPCRWASPPRCLPTAGRGAPGFGRNFS
jgi:hypothetical protein